MMKSCLLLGLILCASSCFAQSMQDQATASKTNAEAMSYCYTSHDYDVQTKYDAIVALADSKLQDESLSPSQKAAVQYFKDLSATKMTNFNVKWTQSKPQNPSGLDNDYNWVFDSPGMSDKQCADAKFSRASYFYGLGQWQLARDLYDDAAFEFGEYYDDAEALLDDLTLYEEILN